MKMTKWHAHVVHMAKHMNPGGGPSARDPWTPLNPALVENMLCNWLHPRMCLV